MVMSGSGKGLLGLWLYRSGEDWAIKSGSPMHQRRPPAVANPGQSCSEDSERTSIVFSLKNQIGGLAKVLNVFQDLGVNVLHIESRKSESDNQVRNYVFFLIMKMIRFDAEITFFDWSNAWYCRNSRGYKAVFYLMQLLLW